MAFTATTIYEIQTTGFDINGGSFDPGATLAANAIVTNATQNTAYVSTVSQNSVSSDVGHWMFLKSGGTIKPGWYPIISQSGIGWAIACNYGSGVEYNTNYRGPLCPTRYSGCSTVDYNTSISWSIDYSQSTSPFNTYDLKLVSATTVSSTLKPFNSGHIGNSFNVSYSSGITLQRYQISAVAGNVATVLSPAANGTINGTGYMIFGGPLGSPGWTASLLVASNQAFIKSGTYTITTTTANASGGPISDTLSNAANAPGRWEGYGSLRCDKGTRPVITAGSQATFTMFAITNTYKTVDNIIFEGFLNTGTTAMTQGGSRVNLTRLTFRNFKTAGITSSVAGAVIQRCAAINCQTGTAAFNATAQTTFIDCEASGCTIPGFNLAGVGTVAIRCSSYNNTGASSDGFIIGNYSCVLSNCVAYNNGRYGFNFAAQAGCIAENCIAEKNANNGFYASAAVPNTYLLACGGYNNTNGNVSTFIPDSGSNYAIGTTYFANATGTFFINAPAGNFALNNYTNQGALARGTGFPGVMPLGLTSGYIDIGLAQHADPYTFILMNDGVGGGLQ